MKDNVIKEESGGWPLEKKVGVTFFVVVLAFYALIAPRFAVPGRWAEMLASFSGIDPFRLPMRPLWSLLTGTMNVLPVSNLAGSVNLLASVLGACVCAMVYGMVRRVPFMRGRLWQDRTRAERKPRVVAGLTAGFFVAFSLPVMAAATRGDFAILDMFLLCAALYPAFLFLQKPRSAQIYASFIIYGIGMAEYPGLVAVVPFFLVWWVVLCWSRISAWKFPLVRALGLMIAASFTVVFAFAVFYQHSPVSNYREIASIWPILMEYAQFHYVEMTRSVPKIGWLLILFSSLLPFIFVMFRSFDEPTDIFTAIGVYAFRLILFAVGIVSLLNLLNTQALGITGVVLLLAPSVMTGAWFGFLAGYHYGLLTRLARSWPRRLYVGALVVLFGVAAYRHTQEIDVGDLEAAETFADQLVGSLDGREWLVTDGSLDAQLLLAARDAGVNVKLLKIAGWGNPMYIRYYASEFADPKLKNLAGIGLRPLLAEWSTSGDLDRHVGLLVSPEYANASGQQVVPSGYFYTLAVKNKEIDPLGINSDAQRRWQSLRVPDLAAIDQNATGARQLTFLARWLSRMANDIGVMLDIHGHRELAAKSYEQSLSFWPDNLSATVNQIAQAKEENPEMVETLEARLDKQVEQTRQQFDLRTANYICGDIRDPALKLGYAAILGRAGQRQQSIQELNGISVLLDAKDVPSRLRLAQLYLQARKPDESSKILSELANEVPGNRDVLYGMYNVAMFRKDYEGATRLMGELEKAGYASDKLTLEQANLDIAAGRLAEARQRLDEITRKTSAPVEAWYALASIAMQEKDGPLMRKVQPILAENRDYAPGMFLLGDLAVQQKELDEARAYFERAVALDPANVSALERLVQIDYDQRDAGALRRHAAQLLVIDPDHALGQYAAANVYIDQKNYDLAEVSLRKCLERGEFAPAQNDLAWILSERGETTEALQLAKRAVEQRPTDGNFWDTLAGVYSKRGENKEALESIGKAVQLTDSKNPVILLHAVELYRNAGQIEKAGEALAKLDAQAKDFPKEMQREIELMRGPK